MPLRMMERKVTIPDGAAASNSFACEGRLVAIRKPASWEATAVELRFEESPDPYSVVDGSASWNRILGETGAEIELSGLTADAQTFQISQRIGPWPRMRIVGTTAVPANVNQTGDAVVTVLIMVEGN